MFMGELSGWMSGRVCLGSNFHGGTYGGCLGGTCWGWTSGSPCM